jgi:PAS domain S-box-containing protein
MQNVNSARDEHRPSVVVVDDSQEVRAVVRHVLEASGFDVVGEGGDGDDAIVLAMRRQPAVMLLDTSMPRADGLEALPAVLAVSPGTRVVVFTGFDERDLAAHALSLGAAGFIEKSVSLEDLPVRLREVLAVPAVAAGSRRGPEPTAPDGTRHGAPNAADAVLAEHVQQFRDLFDRAEIGMATLTSSGVIVRANRALAALMSCEPQDLVGVDYGQLTVGEGDELDRRLDDICALGEDLTSFEHPLPAPLGVKHSRVARATLAPIRDERRQVLYVFAQVQDVTAQRDIERELRRSEENFRRLVTSVSEYAIFMLDRDGVVISWNSGAQRIKGYSAGEIVGQHFGVFYPPEDRAEGRPAANLELALQHGSHAEEGWRVRRDGSRFWASVEITPVYDDGGGHIGFAKVTRDRTQQREYDEERRSLIENQVHTLAVTAHELRNPIAVIDGSAMALRSGWERATREERDGLLASVRSSADRLRRLADDLSLAARTADDTLPQYFDDVSLTDVLGRAAARAHAASGLDVVIDVLHEATFPADPDRLAQALDNLVDNAVRHGSAPVAITGIVGDDVRIRVTDAGAGVADDLVPRLFQRFAITGDTGGTGLGLYLVREIARRHGGDVTYHPPTDDRPTTFELRLPERIA